MSFLCQCPVGYKISPLYMTDFLRFVIHGSVQALFCEQPMQNRSLCSCTILNALCVCSQICVCACELVCVYCVFSVCVCVCVCRAKRPWFADSPVLPICKWAPIWASTEAGVLVRKLSQLTPLSSAKRANPRYFIMFCGISCELAGRVHRPIVDSESTIAGWGQTKP